MKPCPFCNNPNPKITHKRSGNNERVGEGVQVLCGKCKARGPIFTGYYVDRNGNIEIPYTIRRPKNPMTIKEAEMRAEEAWDSWVNQTKTCARDCIYDLCDFFLGEGYYISDPVSAEQGFKIITMEIMKKFPKEYKKFCKERGWTE